MPECVCQKAFGFPSCWRGHGYCPFLDPGNRRGRWRDLLWRQLKRWRTVPHDPHVGSLGRCNFCGLPPEAHPVRGGR